MNTDWIKPKGFHFFDMADNTAIFIECPSKTFLLQTEPGLGERLQRAREGQRNSRPFTHELLIDTCNAVGAKIVGVTLNNVKDGVFFAVVSLQMKNELGEKFIELDARPSDALSLAFFAHAPVLISKKMLDRCENAEPILKKMRARDSDIKA